ncbi:phycobilisome linker polypeptide [Calothrix sp. UHCC 0171]|uniref:phycobilisome linker polypeptide n=1 Tax=Calothrix sp. UHCC 0171 TaxID=3110245 RepID=UPI002B20A66C|nr:phycobilisome linker polypeptide [Calothrix sp. UHCC 0171]MEA5570740.1 phycobilisome linker polypeptide [Calothrix sp. UHCC 0171]
MYGIASDYNSRTVLVEVTGASHKQARNSSYTLKVPLNRLSQTMQRIARTGGKIVNVIMPSLEVTEINPKVETPVHSQLLEVEVSHSESSSEVPTTEEVATVQTAQPEIEKTEAKKPEAKKAEAQNKSSQSLAKKLSEKLPKTSKRAKKTRS